MSINSDHIVLCLSSEIVSSQDYCPPVTLLQAKSRPDLSHSWIENSTTSKSDNNSHLNLCHPSKSVSHLLSIHSDIHNVFSELISSNQSTRHTSLSSPILNTSVSPSNTFLNQTDPIPSISLHIDPRDNHNHTSISSKSPLDLCSIDENLSDEDAWMPILDLVNVEVNHFVSLVSLCLSLLNSFS